MYVVDYNKVQSNFEAMSDAFTKYDVPHVIAYSCKTNNAKEVVDLMTHLGAVPEVVSDDELNMVVGNDFVILNGVAWNDMNKIARCVECGYLVNFNSYSQMVSALRLVNPSSEHKEIGIRVNFDDSSRFGIRQKDVEMAINFARNNGFTVSCIHCHVSGSRPKSKYAKKVNDMISLLMKLDIKPKYIDFGGNMYSEMPKDMKDAFSEVCSFDDYAGIIASGLMRLNYKPIVIVELGTALIANAVKIYGRVIDVDEYGRVVLDISKYAFGNMSAILKEVHYYNIDKPFVFDGDSEQTVYGCTCMEDDVIIHLGKDDPKLEIGDVLVFDNCGAYTYSLCPDFIVKKGDVIIK